MIDLKKKNMNLSIHYPFHPTPYLLLTSHIVSSKTLWFLTNEEMSLIWYPVDFPDFHSWNTKKISKNKIFFADL